MGNEFVAELRRVILAAKYPGRFHPRSPQFRRANLKRFAITSFTAGCVETTLDWLISCRFGGVRLVNAEVVFAVVFQER
jgi:hypothetical protein